MSIQSEDVDLDDVLAGLPVLRASFRMKCMGLQHSAHQRKKMNFQPLLDKMAGKLVTWDGKKT
jgi:hypothetical protein